MSDSFAHWNLSWEGPTPSYQEIARFLANLETADANLEHLEHEFLHQEDTHHSDPARFWEKVIIGEEMVRWPTHMADVARVSQQWPETLFSLDDENYDNNERWRTYFKEDLIQSVRGYTVFPNFDETKLRSVQPTA